jgi:hypothetical protein
MANYLYGAGQLGLNALTNMAAKSGAGILGLSAIGKAPLDKVVEGMKGFEDRNTYALRDDGRQTVEDLADLYGSLPEDVRGAIEYIPKKYQEYNDWVGERSPAAGAAMAAVPAAISSIPALSAPSKVARAVGAVETLGPAKGLSKGQQGVIRAYSMGKESPEMDQRYDKAIELFMEGELTPSEIAAETGWFYDKHSKEFLTLTPTDKVEFYGEDKIKPGTKVSEAFRNKELEKVVDTSRLMQIAVPSKMRGPGAGVKIDRYDPRTSDIYVSPGAAPDKSPTSLFQHEVGHAVHAMQGLGDGANPKMFKPGYLDTQAIGEKHLKLMSEAEEKLREKYGPAADYVRKIMSSGSTGDDWVDSTYSKQIEGLRKDPLSEKYMNNRSIVKRLDDIDTAAYNRYMNVWGEAMARLGAHPELQGKSFEELQKLRVWDPENFKKYTTSDYDTLEYIKQGEKPPLKKP